MEVSQIDALEEKLQREKREPRPSTLLPPTVSASRGSSVPTEQSKATQQSPLHLLLRAAGFKPCPLPGLRLLSCRSRAEKSLTSVHRRNHFHIPTLPEFRLVLYITVTTPPHLGFSLTPSSSTCILHRKNFSGRPQSILSDHCFTTVHFCGKTTLTAANVSRRCPKVCLESHS